jgi:hypothetical protein
MRGLSVASLPSHVGHGKKGSTRSGRGRGGSRNNAVAAQDIYQRPDS